jgi:hypothetical protein
MFVSSVHQLDVPLHNEVRPNFDRGGNLCSMASDVDAGARQRLVDVMTAR